jgi:hypothetical protein
MSEKTFTIQQIIDWCDKMAAEGKNPILKWEGGGDSGWVYMEDEDGERFDEENEAEWLINEMYDQLDYGSWAGEFSANGEAMYNSHTKCFEGTDYYSEEERTSCSAQIRIEIPAFIPFDRLEIETEDETVHVKCDIALDNGYVHPASHDAMTSLEKQLKDEIGAAVDKHYEENKYESEFRDFYNHYVIDRNEFKREGDMMVHILKEVEFNVTNTTEKDISIDLKQLLEDEEYDA